VRNEKFFDIRLVPVYLFIIITGVTMMAGCSGKQPQHLGVKDGKLADCPSTPNCVSTMAADPKRRMEPLKYEGPLPAAREKVAAVVRAMKRARIVSSGDDYIRAEFTSALFRFVDDVEFYFDDGKKLVHFRSASRVGRSDLGVNRKRMEKISRAFRGE